MKRFKLMALAVLCFATSVFAVKKHNDKKMVFANQKVQIYGNDISYWQGEIDFNTTKKVSNFLIIRIGYGTALDKKFNSYMQNALSAGINVGVYVYSLAQTKAQAQNEANWVISTLQNYGYDKGKLTYPIYFDYEENSIITSKSRKENTEIINAFAKVVLDAGFYAGVYMGASHFSSYVNADNLICDVWLAQYFGSNNPTDFYKRLNNSHSSVKMWQFAAGAYTTSTGKTVSSHVKYSGVECGVSSKDIDENWCFVDYPTIIKKGGYNGFEKQNDLDNNLGSEENKQPSSSIVPPISSDIVVNGSGTIVDVESNKNQNSSGCGASISGGIIIFPLSIVLAVLVYKYGLKKRQK